jgi:hypothetical protein
MNKRHTHLKVNHFLLFFLFFIFSCKKEILLPKDSGIKQSISITEAKQFFDANIKPSSRSSAKLMDSKNGIGNLSQINVQDVLNGKQALWNKASLKEISIGTAVRIPLDFGGASLIVNEKKNKVVSFNSLNYLLMYKDSLQRMHTEWVYLLPDSSWLYGNRAQYTGSIIVKNWNGKVIKAYNFEKKTALDQSPIKSGKLSLAGKNQKLASGPGISNKPPKSRYVCILLQIPDQCTCIDKGKCDWCSVCTKQLCDWIVDEEVEVDPPMGSSWPGGSEGSEGGGSGPVTGGPTRGDYLPPNCNPDPNYQVPETPAGEGVDWILPCGGADPIEVIDLPDNPGEDKLEYSQEWYDAEDELGIVDTELSQLGIQHTDPIPESYYINGIAVDMTPAKPSSGRTVKGAPRNAEYFWKEVYSKRIEQFSVDNISAVREKRWKDIKVDEQWVKYNPTHKSFMYNQLVHHHDAQGHIAYAIPAKVHQMYSKLLHVFRKDNLPNVGNKLNTLAGYAQVISLLVDLNTGNPDAWVNWYGRQDQVGRIYKDLKTNSYFQITKKVETIVGGNIIFAKVFYNVYADYFWNEDENRYVGFIKLGTYVEDIDVLKQTTRGGQFTIY